MSQIEMLVKELEKEAQTTRKMLQRIPNDKYDWKPHEKSGTVRWLATHLAELPSWITMTLTTSELDFAKNPYKMEQINNTDQLLDAFERHLKDGKAQLQNASENELAKTWTLRNGETIYDQSSKADVLRMTYCQIVHHRAQLGVYLRLLNVPIPGSYGPSADEMDMFE